MIWTKLLATTNIRVWRTRLWYCAAKNEGSDSHMVPLSAFQIQVMHESNSLFVEYFEFSICGENKQYQYRYCKHSIARL